MSVLIKMKMPKCCDECDFVQHGIGDWCYITEQDLPCICPLIELPDHGDLIDRDTLMCEIADWQLAESPDEGRNWWLGKDVTSHEMQYGIYRLLGDVYEEVRDIPVVIPADRGEDGET